MQTSTAPAQKSWTRAKLSQLYTLPLFELLHQAHSCYREYFPAQRIQLSTLLNVKTGGCQEDCKYCAQSIRYKTGLDAQKLMAVADVVKAAQQAKKAGASRFCMGAAWRELKDRDLDKLGDMVQAVKAEGMETCMTLGMLSESQAKKLADYGLDYYNHNIDTSPEYYPEVISTRSFQDRLDTLAEVNAAGMKVCSGGILGMGESQQDRIGLLDSLANLDPQPQSVPINMLVPIAGTPYEKQAQLDVFELVRTVAVARIAMPNAYVRLSAGRSNLSEEAQAMCFYAGANSIFYGDQLLTTPNNERNQDMALLEKLGINTE